MTRLKTMMGVSTLALAAATAVNAETTLTLLMTEGYDKTAMEAVAAAYMANHPDVTIDIQALPWGQFFQVSEMRMRSGDPELDILYTDVPVIASYAANGLLLPYDAETRAAAEATLVDTSIAAATFEDQLWALPMNSSAQVFFFNKDMLGAAGVTPPAGISADTVTTAADIEALGTDQRWTWEQVADAAKAVKAANGEAWGIAFEQFGELYQLQPLGQSLGGSIISADGMSADGNLNGPAWTEAANWWWSLFNEWEVSPRSLAFGEGAQMFVNGKLAMFVGGTWDVPMVAESGINYGMAAQPRFANGSAATPTGSWYLGINAASPDAAVAKDFVEYATLSQEGTELWFTNLNQLPTTLALLDKIDSDPAYDAFPANIMRLSAWESRNSAVPRPVTVAYAQLQDAFRTAFVDMANGVSVEDALATAVATYDDAASRLNQ